MKREKPSVEFPRLGSVIAGAFFICLFPFVAIVTNHFVTKKQETTIVKEVKVTAPATPVVEEQPSEQPTSCEPQPTE